MAKPHLTVVETKHFTTRAKGRMARGDVDVVIDLIAANPLCGDLI